MISVILWPKVKGIGENQNEVRSKLDMLTGPSRANFDYGPYTGGGGRVQKAVVHSEIQIFKKPRPQ